MRSSSTSTIERLAEALEEGLRRELRLTPKPGLVDLEDCGSHPDLTLDSMERSITLVRGYLDRIAESLVSGQPLAEQVAIGREAEARMLSERRSNTHKGAVFLGGLMLVALHRAENRDDQVLRRTVQMVAGELLANGAPLATHGAAARRLFGVGGILKEALEGLPSIFDGALPAFRSARQQGWDLPTASFSALARLMRVVEDTTALHRCGQTGLERLRQDGLRLEQLLEQRGDHLAFLRECNADYRRMNLTMGGVADLLGVTLGWLVYRGEIPAAE